jgi:rhomboid protease GluP
LLTREAIPFSIFALSGAKAEKDRFNIQEKFAYYTNLDKDIYMLERKKNGSMVCPNCGRLISVNASSCMHCGRKNPGLWGYGPALSRWLAHINGLVPILTAVCVVLFVLSVLLELITSSRPQILSSIWALSTENLYRLGLTGRFAIRQGHWWTLLTAVYLHGGILHILFNLMWLRQLGYMVEELFGTYRAFIIFSMAGITGFVFSVFMGSMFTLGSSGAVFGMLGALIYYGRKRGGYFGAAIFRQVGSWAIMAFIFGFLFPNIDNWAHFGGFIGGYLSAMFLGYREIRAEKAVDRYSAFLLLLLTVIAFVMVAITF